MAPAQERVKVGIIGAGNIFEGWGGGSGHLPGYAWSVDLARVACICDRDPRNLERAGWALRRLYGEKAAEYSANGNSTLAELLNQDAAELRLYTDTAEMFARETLDVADILIPGQYHRDAILQALAVGCHVMCEKPLAMNWEDSKRVAAAVRESGKLFQYSEQLIYGDPYAEMRKLIQKGEIGEPECLWLSMAIGGPGSYEYTRGGVGALLDMGTHAVVVAWFLFGFGMIPCRVRALPPHGISTRIPDQLFDGVPRTLSVEDDAHFAIEFENPETGAWATAYIEVSWSHRDGQDTVVVGAQGRMRALSENQIAVEDVYGNEHTVQPFHPAWLRTPPPPAYSGFPQEIRGMMRCVREGIRPLCDVEIAARSIAILEAASLSEQRGRRPVTLAEVTGA